MPPGQPDRLGKSSTQKMRRSYCDSLTVLALAVALAPFSSADVVYDTLGTGNSYEPLEGWTVGYDPNLSADVDVAVPFIPSKSGLLESIEIPLTTDSGGTASVLVTVHEGRRNPAWSTPTLLVATRYVGAVATFNSPVGQTLLEIRFADPMVLTEGRRYWVTLSEVESTVSDQLLWHDAVVPYEYVVAERVSGSTHWQRHSYVRPGALRVHTATSAGVNVCAPLIPNSTGETGQVFFIVGSVASSNDARLIASRMPPFQLGAFLVARQTGWFPTAFATSNGTLCLAGTVGRFGGPGQLLTSGHGGSMQLEIDLAAVPQGAAFVPVLPGETWYFQAWHRDDVGLGSNFTDAVELTFD